jgi:hypothetical protein
MCSEINTAVGCEINGGRLAVANTQTVKSTKLYLALDKKSTETSLLGDLCNKLRAPHRGTSLGPFVCGANNC